MINIVDSILTMRFIEKIGKPAHIGLEYNMLSLNQPIEESIKDQIVGMKVDFAIFSEIISAPFLLFLKKEILEKVLSEFILL
ncbi:MAG: hypothetical protein H5U37_05875 [Caldisericia bacterium]|nr:hypothetical protein [Caldisericia bacterium]